MSLLLQANIIVANVKQANANFKVSSSVNRCQCFTPLTLTLEVKSHVSLNLQRAGQSV